MRALSKRDTELRRLAFLGALVLVVCVVAVLASPLASADVVAVDRSNAHLAVWKISGGGRAGTAFAISDRHFVTCAHVLKDFFDRGVENVFLSQEGSQKRLRVNHSYAAITLTHDLAVFTTQYAPLPCPDKPLAPRLRNSHRGRHS